VPTAAAGYPLKPGLEFAARGVAWSLALFGLLRLGWFERHAVLPLTQLQGRIAQSGFGPPTLPIDITLACSGADALALCVGAILAYPAAWRSRLTGALGGTCLILALNTIRIGTLGRVAASPGWFTTLHLFVWPGLLMIAVAGYVFGWMRYVDAPRTRGGADGGPPPVDSGTAAGSVLTRRFVILTAALVVLFTAASGWYLESAVVLSVAAFITRAAAHTLGFLGVPSTATGNVLSTSRGAFLVTPECISTPLIPVYVAASLAYPRTVTARILALSATIPLFICLGIARLLVVALPGALVGSPLFLIHAFYQLLLAAVVVAVVAAWRAGYTTGAVQRALLGIALGCVIAAVLGPAYARALALVGGTHGLPDPQGAIAFLPAFQMGLYIALCVAAFTFRAWRVTLAGLGAVVALQAATAVALQLLVGYTALFPQVRDIRAWALAGPVLVVAALVRYDRAPR
jgi:exosortase/archaeosortase family protein